MSKEEIAKQFGPLWKELIAVGQKAEDEDETIANTMTEEQYYEIKETIEYVIPQGLPDPFTWNAQLDADLRGPPHYRLFDAIGMGMGGRYGDDDDVKRWITKIAKAYIGCVKKDGVKTRSELYDCVARRGRE